MRLVQGVGVNDATYPITKYETINDKTTQVWICPVYQKWVSMLKRCYSVKLQEKSPTYTGCSVCEEWLTFSNFKCWMEQQDWEGKELDKDLVFYQNKVYNPEACIFVDKHINNFTTNRSNERGEYPIGVCWKKESFASQVSQGNQRQHLGRFTNPMTAHRAWQQAKVSYAKVLQSTQTDLRVISGLQRVIDKIQNDYDNNLETIDF